MWILGGEFFFWSKAVDPRRKPRVYCLAPEKNPPLISTTRIKAGQCSDCIVNLSFVSVDFREYKQLYNLNILLPSVSPA